MDKLKEKIFGLIVVIALGVIFIPMLFEEGTEQTVPETKASVVEQQSSLSLEKPTVITQLQQHDQKPSEQTANEKQSLFHWTLNNSAKEVNEIGIESAKTAQEKDKLIKQASVEKAEIAEKTEKAASKEAVDRKGWVVQMGTFAEIERARGLIKKLKAAGYPAYSREIQRDSRLLTVVLVGPYVRKEDTIKLKTTLESKFDVNGVIVHYETR